MSKRLNRLRAERSDNIRILEQTLTGWRHFFDALALRRGLARAKRWCFYALCALPVIGLILYAASLGLDKAYGMSIDNISYESRRGFISKEQAMKLLNIGDSVNLATLDTAGMVRTLEENPCIASAHIRAELPETLNIEIEERIPLVYVEMENSAGMGTRQRYFMDKDGVLFPVMEEYHRDVLGVPVWYLHPEDVDRFEVGGVVRESARRPIVELACTANSYPLTDLPRISEIFRPKEWKLILTMENGTEVMMQVYDIREQVSRIAMMLAHARATHRRIRSLNVIPRDNPTATFADVAEPDK